MMTSLTKSSQTGHKSVAFWFTKSVAFYYGYSTEYMRSVSRILIDHDDRAGDVREARIHETRS